jgi:hypothetical protein
VRTTFQVAPLVDDDMEVVVPMREVTLEPLADARIPVFAMVPVAEWPGMDEDDRTVRIRFSAGDEVLATATAPFLGPLQ